MQFMRKIDKSLSRYLPEQRIFLRTDRTTRFMRLKPSTQAFGIASATVFFCWTIIVTSAFLIQGLSADSDKQQAQVRQMNYEARLNALSVERDKRALEARKAQERFYVALEQISAQQTALLDSEDRRKELETGIEVIQRTLRSTMKDRDHARTQSDTLLAELQTVTGNLNTDAGSTADVEGTLDYLNAALAATVAERDAMIVTTQKATEKVAKLKYAAKLVEERNERIFTRLEEAVTVSISPLETMFKNIGVSTDKLLSDVKKGYSGMGGPLTPISVSTKGAPDEITSLKANKLLAEMDKVNLLRIAAFRTPLAMPVKTSYRLSSGFGARRHPVTGKYSGHSGTDFAAGIGTPVYATADGVVTFSGWAGSYGRLVKIKHPMGFETRYAHLNKFRVKVGQRVSRGDRIADMGNSGRSTGPHVHYEVRIGGKAVNPMIYIKAARNVF